MGRRLLITGFAAVLLAGLNPVAASAAERIAVQPDGKIVVAGHTVGYQGFIARLNRDGQLDPGFGQGGIVLDRDLLAPAAVAIQPDGKIVVAAGWSVWRYEANGAPDRQFGKEGVAVHSTGTDPVAIEVLPDGRIVVAANYYAKLLADDAIAYVYSPDGKSVVTLGQVKWTNMAGLALQQAGSLAMAGQQGDKGLLARFSPGSEAPYDPAFGAGSGLVTLSYGPAPLRFDAVAAAESMLYVAGRAGRRTVVGRFSGDGVLDRGFGSQGFAIADTGAPRLFAPGAVGRQGDGAIVVAGERATSPGRPAPCPSCWTPQLLRLTPAGTLDATFGVAGAAGFANADGSPYRARGESLALLPSSRTLIGGETVGRQRGVVLAAFDASGRIEPSFGDDGVAAVVPCPGAEAVPVRRECPPSARARLRARHISRGRPTLSLHVRPNAPWATIKAVRVDFPGMLWVPRSRLRQIEAMASSEGSRTPVDLRKGPYNTLTVVARRPARTFILRLPPGTLRRTAAISPRGRLVLPMQVSFGGDERIEDLEVRSGG
ncbi:MAG TPA: hypothetical protein VHF50_07615 [Solirubrobacterales bacterium]|nr:hypothetical protein [Solirubrobacterales bacterium]